jgi:hypothetical protein
VTAIIGGVLLIVTLACVVLGFVATFIGGVSLREQLGRLGALLRRGIRRLVERRSAKPGRSAGAQGKPRAGWIDRLLRRLHNRIPARPRRKTALFTQRSARRPKKSPQKRSKTSVRQGSLRKRRGGTGQKRSKTSLLEGRLRRRRGGKGRKRGEDVRKAA